jgi:hypothetical protein
MSEKTTSTFTIHHDRCDPSKWTVREWGLLADFVRTGSLSAAAGLSRAGMQLVLDERHAAVGGEAEHIGWLLGSNGDIEHDVPVETIEDLYLEYGEVSEVVPIYRGKTRYAVAYRIGDGEGNFDGTEVKVSDTAEDAERFAKSMREDTGGADHG